MDKIRTRHLIVMNKILQLVANMGIIKLFLHMAEIASCVLHTLNSFWRLVVMFVIFDFFFFFKEKVLNLGVERLLKGQQHAITNTYCI